MLYGFTRPGEISFSKMIAAISALSDAYLLEPFVSEVGDPSVENLRAPPNFSLQNDIQSFNTNLELLPVLFQNQFDDSFGTVYFQISRAACQRKIIVQPETNIYCHRY